MKLPILSRDEVRKLDSQAIEQLGINSLVLMENAGRGCVDILLAQDLPGPYLICCGKGNNAGDGFVMARHLALRSKQVHVLLFSDPAELQGDAAANYTILKRCHIAVDTLAADPTGAALQKAIESAGTIIDALLGTGATSDPRPPYNRVIEALNAAKASRCAIDLPSGLNCDTGTPGQPTFRADHTITLAAVKPGLLVESAAPYVGTLHLADIGVPIQLFIDTKN